MLRHIVMAALRNMAANRLISAIAILGLAVGIAAALLMAAVVRSQTSFDDFLPDHARIYLAVSPPNPRMPSVGTFPYGDVGLAFYLRQHSQDVEAASRLAEPASCCGPPVPIRAGTVRGWDSFYWSDPDIFDVLKLPALRGDLTNALKRPDGVAMTESLHESTSVAATRWAAASVLAITPSWCARCCATFPPTVQI